MYFDFALFIISGINWNFPEEIVKKFQFLVGSYFIQKCQILSKYAYFVIIYDAYKPHSYFILHFRMFYDLITLPHPYYMLTLTAPLNWGQ